MIPLAVVDVHQIEFCFIVFPPARAIATDTVDGSRRGAMCKTRLVKLRAEVFKICHAIIEHVAGAHTPPCVVVGIVTPVQHGAVGASLLKDGHAITQRAVGIAVGTPSARAIYTGVTVCRDDRENPTVRRVVASRHRVGIVKAGAVVAGCAWPTRAFVLWVTPLSIRTQAREEV